MGPDSYRVVLPRLITDAERDSLKELRMSEREPGERIDRVTGSSEPCSVLRLRAQDFDDAREQVAAAFAIDADKLDVELDLGRP